MTHIKWNKPNCD